MPQSSCFRSRPYHVSVISIIATLTLATLTTGAGQDTTLTLFDGQTLTGWSGDPRHWTVEDGALVGRSTEAVPCKETTWLVHTGAPLEHFELTLEVQLGGGNSGVQFRSKHLGNWQVHGPQADHDDSGEWTGGIYEQGGRGVLVRRGTALALDAAGSARSATLGNAKVLLAQATERPWDEVKITCLGATTEVRWNGVLTAKLVDGGPNAWKSEGVVALQLHAGPPMEVRFRNIRAKTLQAPAVATAPVAVPTDVPHWIWSTVQNNALQAVTLRRRVEPRSALQRATLWGACDNVVEVFAGEKRLAVSDDWAKPFEREVTKELGAGAFDLVARCTNEGGPAGLVLRLTLEYTDGSRDVIATDGTWRADVGEQVPTDAVKVLGPFGMQPWGTPSTASNGTPRGVLDPAKLEVPAGFEATLLYEVPRSEGSWVAVTCDDKGRIYTSDERGNGVFRLTERADGPLLVEPLPLDLPSAQGLCPIRRADGGLDLYVMVNGGNAERSNGMWRARDLEDDGTFESVELLVPLPDGSGEHGAHAIVAAPDGSGLYIIAGNHTKLPAEIEVYHAPKVWQEDQLIPPIPDPNGHAVGVPVPGGWFVKTDFDGMRRELVSIGMRNAYDFALDRAGNALTYDSDMEWDMGAPWYRAPRVVQLVPGGDSGWRNGSGKVPDWAEDTLGSVVDTGPASPTGVLHTKDLAFHAPWDDVLLAADWSYGTVHAVSTKAVDGGMTLTGTIRPFIKGKPFPVTDLAAHPDGSLIVTIGGRGTRSGVYRVRSLAGVDHRATAAVPDPIERYRIAGAQPLSDRAWRAYRRAMYEQRLMAGDEYGTALPTLIGTPVDEALMDDRHVRAAGRVAIARTASPLPMNRPLYDGLASEAAKELAQRATRPSDDSALATLRAIELSLARTSGEAALAPERALELVAHYPSGDPRIDRVLAALLVRSRSAELTPRAVARLVTADTQEEALHLAYLLRVHEVGWTPELVDTFLTFLHTKARGFHGGHSLQRYVEIIRNQATERLGQGWTPPQVVASVPVTAPPIAASIFVQEWEVGHLHPREGELAQRDLARGRHVYQAARCAECHRFAGEGGSTGPDLSGAGARYSAEDLLLAILEPSRDLTDQYQDTEVWTTDGTVHMGRVVEEDNEWLTLMPPPPNEAERIDVLQKEVKLKRPHPTSRMPNALLNGFRREEVLDLLAYLLGGPQAAAPVDKSAPTPPSTTNGAGDAGAASPGEPKGSDDRSARALEAELHSAGQPGFAELQRTFATANAGYALSWLEAGSVATLAPTAACSIVFVQSGEGMAMVANVASTSTSAVRSGDIVVVRKGEALSLMGASALVIDVPAPPPSDVPTIIRPDFDPRITDTPGGCAEEADAYRRILLTWQGKNGPYLFHALNAHRVRIMDSFTHYHPVRGGFDELYLVQSAPAGAELIVSEQLDMIRGIAAVTKADVPGLIRRIPLEAGDLVYLPRGVVHRGVGGAVVQVITVPGFVPGAEIGVDAALAALNSTLGLNADEALPVHK
jgi:putative heme-binding domain-containing protein